MQAQFLLEALVLSSLSGLAGAVLGVAASGIFSRALSWPTIIPPQWIVIAVAFSAVIGVFFGFYPARKARAPRSHRGPPVRVDRAGASFARGA